MIGVAQSKRFLTWHQNKGSRERERERDHLEDVFEQWSAATSPRFMASAILETDGSGLTFEVFVSTPVSFHGNVLPVLSKRRGTCF